MQFVLQDDPWVLVTAFYHLTFHLLCRPAEAHSGRASTGGLAVSAIHDEAYPPRPHGKSKTYRKLQRIYAALADDTI